MHRNYYLFEQQIKNLAPIVTGAKLIDCFTFQKNELILQISANQTYHLAIGVGLSLPFIILRPERNIKLPRMRLFEFLIGEEISNINIKPFDKIVHIKFKYYTLQAVFFGKTPNVFILNPLDEIVDEFKHDGFQRQTKKHDIIFNPSDCNPEKFSSLIQQDDSRNLEDYLCHHFGGFNTLLARELCFRCRINCAVKINQLQKTEIAWIVEQARLMVEEMQTSNGLIYTDENRPVHFSLVKLSHLQNLQVIDDFVSVNEAWNQFVSLYIQKLKTEKVINRCKTAVQNRIAYLKRTLEKISEAQQLEQRKKEAELKGNLILSSLRQIPPGLSEIDLPNIFSDQQELINIKLNPAKTPQENAQKYFEKFKNLSEKKFHISTKKDTFQHELRDWLEIEKRLLTLKTLKDAEKFEALLIDKNIIQSPEEKNESFTGQESSFNRLLLGKKWEIYIGKNDRNNDLLTFKFAHKFDLWFHAQGVPGSHVIIRLPGKDQLPPHDIIEQTAAVTAYFSSARNSSTVPVNYTEVRYVRKPRKAAAGTVTITREKTIFVKPLKLI